MIRFKKMLAEASNAAQEARKLGLKYAGFGRWIEPDSRKLIAVTKNGKLVKVKHAEGGKGLAAPEKDSGSEGGKQNAAQKIAGPAANAGAGHPQQPKVPMPQTRTGEKRALQFRKSLESGHYATAALINSLENNKFAKNLSPEARRKLTLKSLNQLSDNMKKAVTNDVKKALERAKKAIASGSFFGDEDKQKVQKMLPYLQAAMAAISAGDFAEAFQQLARAPYNKTFYPNKALDIFYRYSFYDQINKFAIE